jgi:hypothetical protein
MVSLVESRGSCLYELHAVNSIQIVLDELAQSATPLTPPKNTT